MELSFTIKLGRFEFSINKCYRRFYYNINAGLTGGLRLSKNPASTLSVGGDFTFTAGNFFFI
ncbi:MAG: hypothetical protein IPL24_13630 [Bacteroidetes bacterium]|nr:hypothetical protein [Bacteroidota bacterium]